MVTASVCLVAAIVTVKQTVWMAAMKKDAVGFFLFLVLLSKTGFQGFFFFPATFVAKMGKGVGM